MTGAAQLKSSPHYSEYSAELRKQIDRAWDIMETTDLWMFPTMNPDGFARGSESECLGDLYSDGKQNEGRKVTQRKPDNVITLGQCQPDNIHSMITIANSTFT